MHASKEQIASSSSASEDRMLHHGQLCDPNFWSTAIDLAHQLPLSDCMTAPALGMFCSVYAACCDDAR